jgi:peptidoglycan/LPS O-acetylase OafA/YrhL
MFLTQRAFASVLPELTLTVVSPIVALTAAWVIHELVEVPSRRFVLKFWRRGRSVQNVLRAPQLETPAEQMNNAIGQLRNPNC